MSVFYDIIAFLQPAFVLMEQVADTWRKQGGLYTKYASGVLALTELSCCVVCWYRHQGSISGKPVGLIAGPGRAACMSEARLCCGMGRAVPWSIQHPAPNVIHCIC